jgi:putative ABC transport system permease protein
MKYSGILRIGFKLLVNDKTKFYALLMGITFAVFLMMQMTAMFAGILNRAYATVTNIGASVWVMDRGVNTPRRGTQHGWGQLRGAAIYRRHISQTQ